MAVHPGSRTLPIGKALFLKEDVNHRQGLRATCTALRREILGLYTKHSDQPKGV
jgi:hypothetical protein